MEHEEYADLEKIGSYNHAHRTLALEPGQLVVDVGCGAGGFLRWLSARDISAIGVECGEVMLAEAKQNDSGDVREGVGQDLPIDDNVADAVVFMASLHHIPAEDMAASLAEAARVLKPGGRVYVTEPVPIGPSYEVGRLVDDEAEVRAVAQQALANSEGAGLRVLEEGRHLDEYVYRDVEAFGRAVVGVDPTRAARYDQVKDAVADAFAANGRRTELGMAFDQPKRFHVLATV